ncbi:MAG TPA: hypothetical protein DC017_12590 [Candidatus Wallbacteria bacterium]|nr:hypothetical protein [Candidatus Wallbacteria bacterium]
MNMKAFVIRTDTSIPPFNDHCGDILILNEKLRDYQSRVLTEAGFDCKFVTRPELKTENTAGALIFDDDIFFTPEFLNEFIARSLKNAHETSRAALEKTLFTKQIAILQNLGENESIIEYPLYFSKSAGFDPSRAANVIINPDEFFESGHFPDHMIGKDHFKFAVTSRAIVRVCEPIHIAMVNMAANFARLARFRKLGIAAKLGVLFRARSINESRILSALSIIERGAKVHPTAVVEGSVIKAGAIVGAYAVVRFSVVGSGAYIDDHSAVKFSVVGEKAYIANNNVIFFSVVYPRAFLISGPYQFSCFGYDSAVMNSIPSDYRLDGKTISVMCSGGVKDTGLRFAGSIIGHRARIAAGLIIAPGRMIPNDVTLYPDPAMVVNKVPPEAGEKKGAWFLIGGKLTDKI